MLCEAFAQGCGGIVADHRRLLDGAAFFYGVVEATLPLWNKARAEGRDVYYCDNAYFDRGRQAYFRVTKNAFQVDTLQIPDYRRLDSIGVKVTSWSKAGKHVIVCEQSDAFMRLCGYGSGWLEHTIAELKQYTSRPLKIRRWHPNKGKQSKTLKEDLIGAWALVTHMSASANEAVVSGVPVFLTGRCAASPMGMDTLKWIEVPAYPLNVRDWAAGLVARQWTIEELKNGTAWEALNATKI